MKKIEDRVQIAVKWRLEETEFPWTTFDKFMMKLHEENRKTVTAAQCNGYLVVVLKWLQNNFSLMVRKGFLWRCMTRKKGQ